MLDQTTYNICSTIILLVLGIIWSKNGYRNLFIKLVCLAVGAFGLFIFLKELGYIIKI
jgi:hypothetical protein